jgi:hypothetical protein
MFGKLIYVFSLLPWWPRTTVEGGAYLESKEW